jgi:RNA polymerase sigma-70 factor (ECF subfamily)
LDGISQIDAENGTQILIEFCNNWLRIRNFLMSMVDSADSALIESTLKGDEWAFAELVRRYQAAVWGTVHRVLGNTYDNEDAVQEVFLRAFTALHKFDLRYPFGPWILRITTNYCIDQLRRKKGRKIKLWSELGEYEQQKLLRDLSRESDQEPMSMDGTEGYARVAQALLDGLNPKYRAAFVLREVEERAYDEVAEALGTSEVAARVRVSRARAELQKKFRAYLSGLQRKERKQN